MASEESYPSDWTPEDIASVQPIPPEELQKRLHLQQKRQRFVLWRGLQTDRSRVGIAQDNAIFLVILKLFGQKPQ